MVRGFPGTAIRRTPTPSVDASTSILIATFALHVDAVLDRALSIFDDGHSSGEEDRWITMGRAGNDLVVMVHTFREVSPDEAVVRIISARISLSDLVNDPLERDIDLIEAVKE